MASNYKEWDFQLVDTRTRKPIDDDAGLYTVLTDGSPAEATVYSDDSGTTATLPLTMTDGRMTFYTDSTISAVDLSVLTNGGRAYFLDGVVQSAHRVDVDPERSDFTLVLPMTYNGASDAVVDTGFALLDSMLVKDVFIDVHTAADASGAILLDVGTSTDTDGFLDGVLMDVTGMAAIAEDLVSGSIGTLLASTTGPYVRKLHWRANATSGTSIVYANASSAATAGLSYIYMQYHRIPTRA
jgi:hypothetical protein